VICYSSVQNPLAFHIAKLRAEHTLRVSDVGSHCAESNRKPENSAYDRIKKGWMGWSYCKRGGMTSVHKSLL
jgi:protein-arginine kinase activator protein McsA